MNTVLKNGVGSWLKFRCLETVRCYGRGAVAVRQSDLDRRLIHQHDGDVVLHRVDAVALAALQALGILAVVECLLARRTNQDLQ